MEPLKSSTSLEEFWLNPHILVNLVIILTASIVIAILKLLISIIEPMNYELDLTTKEYCKSLAEIDNNAELRSNRTSELYSNDGSQDGAINRATDLPNGWKDSNNNRDVIENSSSDNNAGNLDYIYPNGWIPLIESVKVTPGSIKKAIIFGKDVIVTRSADGSQINVLDAYCPHMGVHIGISGQVTQIDGQSCVECPFHGWTFRASDGQCVKIPYQKNSSKSTIPKQARLGTWLCAEVDNFIYVWHHTDNQTESTYDIIPSDKILLFKWHLAGRSCHKTYLDLRDMHENGADMNHFEGIHNDLFILGGRIAKLKPLRYLQQYTRHHWLPDWKPVLDDLGRMTHKAQMSLQSWISLFKLRLFDITVHATQIGPARVNLYYNSKWYGEGLITMNAIPIRGRLTKYIQHIYTHNTLFQCFMAKWVLYGEIKMLERDFFIWNHKKTIKNPIFIPEDKTLKQFRLWYSQFYKRKRKITIQSSENVKTNGETISCKSHDF